jgi:hypothetical protein
MALTRATLMKIAALGLLASLFLIVVRAAAIDTPAHSSLEAFKNDLQADKIKRVKVLFLPYEVLTRAALSPEALESSVRYGGVVYIRPFGDSMRGNLLAALDKIQIREKLDYHPDLRWGAVFYGIADHELHSLYMERRMLGSTQRGMIDGESLSLNSAITDWFENTFPDVMRAAADRIRR